jgi:hypothetical protein
MGFVITGCANLMILGEVPSYPVAFLMFDLFIKDYLIVFKAMP